MIIVVLILAFLWLGRNDATQAGPGTPWALKPSTSEAGLSNVTGAELAEIQAMNAQGLPAPAPFRALRASGLAVVGQAEELARADAAHDGATV